MHFKNEDVKVYDMTLHSCLFYLWHKRANIETCMSNSVIGVVWISLNRRRKINYFSCNNDAEPNTACLESQIRLRFSWE